MDDRHEVQWRRTVASQAWPYQSLYMKAYAVVPAPLPAAAPTPQPEAAAS